MTETGARFDTFDTLEPTSLTDDPPGSLQSGARRPRALPVGPWCHSTEEHKDPRCADRSFDDVFSSWA